MLTGFEALGAASAVLQVISFASDLAVACKNAYDGATTSQDDLQRYAGRMSEAVDCVHTRCETMSNANSKFVNPKLQTIAKECKDAANKLEAEVQYVTSLQAKGDIVKSLRKAFRVSRHQKKLQALQESLSMYQQVIKTELVSHLCSQSDAIYFQQDASFGKLDTDIQFLINQLAQGITDVKDLVKQEHAATRNAITQESARAEAAINWHTDSQVLKLRTTSETKRKCEVFLQSLKAPLMNQRYNEVMDSRDASFNQVFASYEDMKTMYHCDPESDGSIKADDLEDDNPEDNDSAVDYASEDDGNVKGHEISEAASNSDNNSLVKHIHRSWASFNSWLQSDDKLFYIQGKPGSGKSTLVKFILDQEQTKDLVQRWSPDATIFSYFFWKIGSEEQKSIKGLWCSLLYQRLQDQQQLILSILQRFNHLSHHSEYHDWAMKDLKTVWDYLANMDNRHLCIFVDGLDEIRNEDGFSKLLESIDTISMFPEIKLCVSTRPEARIVRWLKTKKAAGILLEDLTRYDMLVFVQKRFRELSPNSQVSSETSRTLRWKLVAKAQGVFLWLYLATRSVIDGIENMDSENMLFARLNALPGDLENLYIDMWQRMNANSPVYLETARRYFRYVLQDPGLIDMTIGQDEIVFSQPRIVQIACAENLELQEKLLKGTDTIGLTEILRRCEDTTASIHNRCAGLLEVRSEEHWRHVYEKLGNNSDAFGKVAFIHRTAHDFLTDTEAGRGILGCGPLSGFSSQTQLLNGLICMAIVVASELTPSYTSLVLIFEIIDFAKRWGNEGLQLATRMLDIVRPLYDRKFIRFSEDLWVPSDPFLSQLTQEDLFDDFVISRLATENSTALATSVLREGWAPGPDIKLFKRLSKRLFFALIKLGAVPHEYGAFYDLWMQPFARKETAFTNLLVSFLISTKWPEIKHQIRIDDELHRKELLETLEIAIHMATTCQNLNAVVSLFACIPVTGTLMMIPFGGVIDEGGEPTSRYFSMICEVNIEFLLLYLLSKVGGNLADCVLAAPQAQDVLSRIDSPLVKIRYFQLPREKEDKLKQESSSQKKYQRIVSPVPLLISDIEQLFDVDFEGLSQDLRVPHEDKTDLYTINQYIKDVETEEVNVEDMMTTLAAENLGFCTYEEAGITPPYEYLRNARERNHREWMLFPLAMGRLEAAAAIKEGIEGHE
ncbi:related to small s protein [Fusarium oxysporum]|uniref:Related to small s protein n=1 Tax=Fusarium oxysporum TaxID=5507 RepID=A0A2H3TNJ2_FUSOX|nr:related to small s protein [Fusarium oxysporum]